MRCQGKDYNAHRLAYELAKGSIPTGMEIMHTCDIPHCVNPNHLRLGTHAENMADCKAKRRHVHGQRNTHAKLTEEQAKEILFAYKKTGWRSNAKELAEKYGVTPESVNHIGARRTWKYL